MPEMTMTPPAAAAAVAPASASSSGAADAATAAGQITAAFATVLQEQIAKPGKAVMTTVSPALIDLAAQAESETEDAAPGTGEAVEDPALNALLALFVPLTAASPLTAPTVATPAGAGATAAASVALSAASGDPQSPAPAPLALGAPKVGAVPVEATAAAAAGQDAAATTLPISIKPEANPTIALAEAAAKSAAVPPRAAEPIPTGAIPSGDTPAAQNLLAHASAPAASSHGATMRIEAALGTPQWQQEVGQRVTWLAGRNQGNAELILTPPSLGRIEISLSVSGDTTNAYFVSANPTVRDALEQALPRLREVLADAGINLGQASVNAESAPRDDQRKDETGSRGEGPARSRAAAGGPLDVRIGRGLVDTFA